MYVGDTGMFERSLRGGQQMFDRVWRNGVLVLRRWFNLERHVPVQRVCSGSANAANPVHREHYDGTLDAI